MLTMKIVEARNLVRDCGGLEPLCSLLEVTSNTQLLAAATGAIWKCADDSKSRHGIDQNITNCCAAQNVAIFIKLIAVKKLVGLVENQPEDVVVNVVGALGACAKAVDGRQAIRESGGINVLLSLLTRTNSDILVNVTQAIGACAVDGKSIQLGSLDCSDHLVSRLDDDHR